MAKRTETEDGPLIFDDSAEEYEDMALLNILADLDNADTAELKVYRAGGKGYHGKQSYLFTCHPDEFSLDKLRDEYGGGEFRVHVRANGQLKMNRAVSVEPPKKQAENPLALMGYNNQMEDRFTALIEAMQQQNQQNMALILQVIKGQDNAPKIDPHQQMNDMLALMVNMKSFLGGGDNTNQVELLLKGIELAKDIHPSDKETSTIDLLLEGLKTFGKPIADMALKGASEVPRVIPAGITQSKREGQRMIPSPIQMMIKSKVKEIVSVAAKNKDVEPYGEIILDQMDENPILHSFLSKETWFKEICGYVPEAAKYEDWFKRLHKYIFSDLTGEDEGDITIDGGVTIIAAGANASNGPIVGNT